MTVIHVQPWVEILLKNSLSLNQQSQINPMQKERGYALIEIVFLVAIIAILSSVIIPKISNELQIAQADYLMKSLYSELRFMQAAQRINVYKKEDILPVNKKMKFFILVSNNDNKRYRIRFDNSEELRKYKLPSNFSFEDDFYLVITEGGTVSNNFTSKNSDTIRLKDNIGKFYKPFIVFDSVGRIRFSNSDK